MSKTNWIQLDPVLLYNVKCVTCNLDTYFRTEEGAFFCADIHETKYHDHAAVIFFRRPASGVR